MWIFFCNWWSICVSWIYHHLMFRYLLICKIMIVIKKINNLLLFSCCCFSWTKWFLPELLYLLQIYDFDSSHEWWEFILMLLFLIKLNDHHTHMKLDMGLCSHMMSIGCLEETTGYNINATVTIKTKYTITDRTHS